MKMKMKSWIRAMSGIQEVKERSGRIKFFKSTMHESSDDSKGIIIEKEFQNRSEERKRKGRTKRRMYRKTTFIEKQSELTKEYNIGAGNGKDCGNIGYISSKSVDYNNLYNGE